MRPVVNVAGAADRRYPRLMISMAGLWGMGLVLGWLTHRLCGTCAGTWRNVLAVGGWLGLALGGVWAIEGQGAVTMALAGMAGAGWRGALLEWVKRLERKGPEV
jgi:hypothetical protein